MKRLIFIFLMMFLLVGTVSALEFDNVKEYSDDDRKVTITNAFGFGDKIAELELITPKLNSVLRGRDRRVLVMDIENFGDLYTDGLKEMQILDMNDEGSEISKVFHYELAVYEDVRVYQYNTTCDKELSCTQEVIGSHVESQITDWVVYNGKDLPKGKITIALVTDVFKDDHFDGIPTIFGEKLTRWAEWTESLNEDLILYYAFDARTGTNVQENVTGVFNGTTNNMENSDWVTGLINRALDFDGADEFVTIGNGFTGMQNFTVSMWANTDAAGGDGNERLISNAQTGGAGDVIGMNRPSEEQWQFNVQIDGNSQTALDPASIVAGVWVNIVGTYNGTSVALYKDGVFIIQASTGFSNLPYETTRPQFFGDCDDQTCSYNGQLDEIGFWNRTLSGSEITQLYNGGAGIQFTTEFGLPTTLLLSPANDTKTNNLTQEFVCSSTVPSPRNLTNISFFHDASGTFQLEGNFTVNGTSANATFTDTFVDGTYNWSCGATNTDSNFVLSESNRTITFDTVTPFIEVLRPTGSFDYVVNGSNDTLVLEFQVTEPLLDTCLLEYPTETNVSIDCAGGQNNVSFPASPQTDLTFFANDSAGNLASEQANWIYTLFEESESFNATTTETSLQSFSVDLIFNSSLYSVINAEFSYEGTTQSAIKSQSGDDVTFSASQGIPIGSGVNQFFWNVSVTNTTGTFAFESPLKNQTVNALLVGACNVTLNVPILNFTSEREDNLTEINPFLFEATFEFSIGGSDITKNVTIPQASVPSKAICVSPGDTTITGSGQVKYDGIIPGDFVARDFFFDNDIFTNDTTNTTLYLLNSADSTSFILIVQDQTIVRIPAAFVFIERFYPGLNEFRIVQVAKTDDNGQTVGFYETETVEYRHVIKKGGETLLQTNSQKIVGEETPFTLTFTIGELIDDPLDEFQDVPNLDASLVFTNNNKLVTFTYDDTSSSFLSSNLRVEFVNPSSLNTQICNENKTSSSGIITCDLSTQPVNGTYISYGSVVRNPTVFTRTIQFLTTDNVSIFGATGLFLAWFIILVAAMTGIWNPTVGVILTNIAVILVNIIGIATFAPIFIFGMLGVSLIVIILLKT